MTTNAPRHKLPPPDEHGLRACIHCPELFRSDAKRNHHLRLHQLQTSLRLRDIQGGNTIVIRRVGERQPWFCPWVGCTFGANYTSNLHAHVRLCYSQSPAERAYHSRMRSKLALSATPDDPRKLRPAMEPCGDSIVDAHAGIPGLAPPPWDEAPPTDVTPMPAKPTYTRKSTSDLKDQQGTLSDKGEPDDAISSDELDVSDDGLPQVQSGRKRKAPTPPSVQDQGTQDHPATSAANKKPKEHSEPFECRVTGCNQGFGSLGKLFAHRRVTHQTSIRCLDFPLRSMGQRRYLNIERSEDGRFHCPAPACSYSHVCPSLLKKHARSCDTENQFGKATYATGTVRSGRSSSGNGRELRLQAPKAVSSVPSVPQRAPRKSAPKKRRVEVDSDADDSSNLSFDLDSDEDVPVKEPSAEASAKKGPVEEPAKDSTSDDIAEETSAPETSAAQEINIEGGHPTAAQDPPLEEPDLEEPDPEEPDLEGSAVDRSTLDRPISSKLAMDRLAGEPSATQEADAEGPAAVKYALDRLALEESAVIDAEDDKAAKNQAETVGDASLSTNRGHDPEVGPSDVAMPDSTIDDGKAERRSIGSKHSQHSKHSKHSKHSRHSETSKHSKHSKHSRRSEHFDQTRDSKHSKHSRHNKHSKHKDTKKNKRTKHRKAGSNERPE